MVGPVFSKRAEGAGRHDYTHFYRCAVFHDHHGDSHYVAGILIHIPQGALADIPVFHSLGDQFLRNHLLGGIRLAGKGIGQDVATGIGNEDIGINILGKSCHKRLNSGALFLADDIGAICYLDRTFGRDSCHTAGVFFQKNLFFILPVGCSEGKHHQP